MTNAELIQKVKNETNRIFNEQFDQFHNYKDGRYSEGIADGMGKIEQLLDTIDERIKEEKAHLEDSSIIYREAVLRRIESKRVLPKFQGQLLHDFKNELNTMKQILGLINWPNTQYVLFEKFALVFATWGGYHFHPKDVDSDDEPFITEASKE